MAVDLYRVLQVSRSASTEVIEASYKALTSKLAKDLQGDPSKLSTAMRVLAHAYEVLSNPARRAEHDRQVYEATEPPTYVDLTSTGHAARTVQISGPDPVLRQSNAQEGAPDHFQMKGRIRARETRRFSFSWILISLIVAVGFLLWVVEPSTDRNSLQSKFARERDKFLVQIGIKEPKVPNTRSDKNLGRKSSNEIKLSKESKPTESTNVKVTPPPTEMKASQNKQTVAEAQRLEQLKLDTIRDEEAERKRRASDAELLRCEKARLHHANIQQRIDRVNSIYAEKIKKLEDEKQNLAIAGLIAGFKDRSAFAEAGNRIKPIDTRQGEIKSNMNDELSILQTELEQYRIENLECFR